MKKAAIIACTLLFVCIAGMAETKSPPPLSAEVLAAILTQPSAAGSCPTPQNEVLFAARRPGVVKSCNASALCESGSVNCSYTGTGGTCTFADRNCAVGEQGHVTCQGVTTWCPTVCPSDCGNHWCCSCDETGDCFSCCKCGGGTTFQCANQC